MLSSKQILQAKCSGIEGATAQIQTMALEETKVFIKNYCHLASVPPEMNYIWANMALDLIKGAYISTNIDDLASDFKPSEVNSMSAGDMSLSRDSGLMAHKVDLDSLLFNYREQLNQFRRMNFGCPRNQFWGS